MQFFLESNGTPSSLFEFKGSYSFDSSLGSSSFISSLLHDKCTSITLTTPRIPTTAITTPAVKFHTPVTYTTIIYSPHGCQSYYHHNYIHEHHYQMLPSASNIISAAVLVLMWPPPPFFFPKAFKINPPAELFPLHPPQPLSLAIMLPQPPVPPSHL